MHTTLAKIVEHMRTKHADRAGDLDGVIRECSGAGFAPVFITEGLKLVFQIPHGEAKRLVVSHFFRGDARAELDRFHSELEAALTVDKAE